MRTTRGWTGLRASVVALGLVAAAAGGAQASPMVMTYDTIGSTIGMPGVVMSPDVVHFVPVSGGSFLAPSALSLGGFQVDPLPAGQSVTYTNLPFALKFTTDTVNGQSVTPNETPVTITGHLNGTLTGTDQSNLTATFDQTGDAGSTFLTGLSTNTLKVTDNPLTLVPSTTNNGVTTVQALLTSTPIGSPVPEPSTALLFAATAAGLGLRHKLRRGRAA